MNACTLDDEIINNFLLDLSAKKNEKQKVELQEELNEEQEIRIQEDVVVQEEYTNVQEEVEEEKLIELQEEYRNVQEEVEEEKLVEVQQDKSITNSFNNIVKSFVKYINEIIKSGTEPLYNDK